MGKAAKENLKKIIEDYILLRQNLTSLFVLVDCRHMPQQIDLDFMEWLGENEVPFSIIFTKADKISAKQLKENTSLYKNKLLEVWEELPPIFITSAEKSVGRNELLAYIEEINASLK
jgi:GTP-binding protein